MPPDASADTHANLRRECRAFTRYLTGRDPDHYVETKYVEVHAAALRDLSPSLPIDAALVRWAGAGLIRARIADAYGRIFRSRGLLRRKLILMLAILENSRGFHRDFTAGGRAAPFVAVLQIAGAVTMFALALGAGVIAFGPRQLLIRALRVEERE